MRNFILLALLLGYFNSFGQLTVNIVTTNATCGGVCDGTATANASGGVPPYMYSWNSAPIQYFDSAIGLCAGTYIVSVTDSLGATAMDTVIISEPPMLSSSFITVNNSCFGSCDGSATVVAIGGTPPYTYSWLPTGGITTYINGLCPGIYTAVVTDSNGCVIAPQVAISNPAQITATITTTDDTCGLCVGSAFATVTGGTPPYTYTWIPSNITIPFTQNLCAGNYTCMISDMNGCVEVFNAVVNDLSSTCELGTVSGKVYNDLNADCNQDTLENGLWNIMLVATPGSYYASTNSNGEYTMVLPFGNYTITQVLPPYLNEICPVSGSYTLVLDSINNTITNIDFADTITSVQDVRVQLTSSIPRPGFYYTYYLNYTSINSVPMNGVVSLVYDATILTYSTSSIAPDIISGDTLFWNYSNLQMFENRGISATFYVPANVNLLGDTLNACAQITPLIGDVNIVNNSTCHDRIITGAYDPNDKQVSPEGDILLSDNELKYTIRFQNTGTDTAFTVVVVDTLSSKLDVTSIKKVMASHPFEYNISGQGVLTFTFDNILLPDSNVNEAASHGLIEFTINQHPSNSVGTIIENTAEIYFDFNPAIVTNTTTNTIVLPTTIEEIKLSNVVSVYPNPTEGRIKISFNAIKENEVNIALFDITGRKVNELTQNKKMSGTQLLDWNIGNVKSGIYFLSVKIGDKSYTNKIVVR
jgi:hypothetical protein